MGHSLYVVKVGILYRVIYSWLCGYFAIHFLSREKLTHSAMSSGALIVHAGLSQDSTMKCLWGK